ncbi:luciferin 4-monooxygenase [Pectinophora gossypiella]|uniref:luciferin 4-monooxygenase n=1 Tax=Pectinophora gossypiella TaxID=13191 RepID=UPI00214EED14|nr:luciferin 4-monooxygenase [Pectinophora gossypiella]
MLDEIHIRQRITALRLKAAQKYDIIPEKCHVGHVVLQAMLEAPARVHQIEGVSGQSETNLSVATRSMRLASAMRNSGIQINDHVVNMGHNHLDLGIPYYACHLNGYSQCAIDPRMTLLDLTSLFGHIDPKIIFAPQEKLEDIKTALDKNNKENVRIVIFDDKKNDLEAFIAEHKGTDEKFRPAEFDQAKTIAWLMLTSGTTGLPKVAIIPFETLLNGLCLWWAPFTKQCSVIMAITTIQWMSSLYFFISSPIMKCTRVQCSMPMTPQLLVMVINKYRPNITVWSPFLLAQFINAVGSHVDLSCFTYIAIGGSAIDKALYDKFSEKCDAYLYLVYGMTELLVPVFDFKETTPFGSTGVPFDRFQYKLVDDDGTILEKPHESGELWIKGDAFFKGYLNNPEETDKLLTNDGWLKTGDIFYRDENNYYFFVERKRLLIKYTGFWISPLQLEDVIKKHPGVEEVCVVGIPNKETNQTPVAVIVRKKDHNVQPQQIFDLVKSEMPEIKQIHGGLFFVDALPETPSGKAHRAKIRDMAVTAEKIFPVKQ